MATSVWNTYEPNLGHPVRPSVIVSFEGLYQNTQENQLKSQKGLLGFVNPEVFSSELVHLFLGSWWSKIICEEGACGGGACSLSSRWNGV